jgi:hypothetical protein
MVQQDWPYSVMLRFDLRRPQVVGGTTFKLKFGHHGGNHPIRHNKDGGLLCGFHLTVKARGTARCPAL